MYSDSTLLTFDIPSYSMFCTIQHFFIRRFVPFGYFSIRHFVPFGVFSILRFHSAFLTIWPFVPFDLLYHSAFFPFDVLSHSVFCLSMFCRLTFCTFGICYFDLLSVNHKKFLTKWEETVIKISAQSEHFYVLVVKGLSHSLYPFLGEMCKKKSGRM